MKTFSELLELAEKYYAPNQKLPSGKTPVQKAINKQSRRGINSLITTKVKRGADNKNYSPHSNHPDVDVDAYENKYMTVNHAPSGISFHVAKGTDGIHTVEWMHGRNRENLSHSERVKLFRTADRIWHKHVVPNMPHNSVIHNRPSPDEPGEKNKRASIYQRWGFGPIDKHGDQFGVLKRPASPKQQKAGKKSIKPLNPEKVKKDVNWVSESHDEVMRKISRSWNRNSPGSNFNVQFRPSKNDHIYIGLIDVNKNKRGSGKGSRFVRGVTKYADMHNLPVSVKPVHEKGYKAKLRRFYTKHGFEDNNNNNKEIAPHPMIRKPK